MRSTWRRALLISVVLCLPWPAFAADQPGKVELGFVPFGFSVISDGDEDITIVGVPGGGSLFGLINTPGLYLQCFVTDKLAVEPQLSAMTVFADGDNFRMISLATRANYLFRGVNAPSAYLFASGGLVHIGESDGEDENNPTLGFGFGFRHPVRSIGSVRIEAGYQRIFHDDADFRFDESGGANTFGMSVGVALRF